MNTTGKKFGGRKAGTPNKLTQSAREAFSLSFNSLGGSDGLTKWARENQTDFYKLFSRLIPISARAEEDIEEIKNIEILVVHRTKAEAEKEMKDKDSESIFTHTVRKKTKRAIEAERKNKKK